MNRVRASDGENSLLSDVGGRFNHLLHWDGFTRYTKFSVGAGIASAIAAIVAIALAMDLF
jgi:hypothetical protein